MEQQADFNNPTDLTYAICEQFFNRVKDRDTILEQLNLMHEQNALLRNIKACMDTKNTNTASFLTQSDENQPNCNKNSSAYRNSVNAPFRRSTVNFDKNTPRNVRKTNQLNINEIEDSLSQVQQRCETETYDNIKMLLKAYKDIVKQLADVEYALAQSNKDKKAYENMKNEVSVLQKRMIEQQKKIKKQEVLLNSQKQVSEKQKKTMNSMVQRQRVLVKSQTALLIKDKLLSEDLKKLQSKTTYLKKLQKQISEQRQIVQQIWDNVMIREEIDQQFRSQIYIKCKDNLMKQRKTLVEQEQELQKQHTYIEKIIAQLQGIIVTN